MAPDSRDTGLPEGRAGIRHVKHGAQLSQITDREGPLQTGKDSFSSIKVDC